MKVPYDATTGRLPIAPRGKRLTRVTFETCPGTTFRIDLHSVIGDAGVDDRGMSRNSWWLMECTDMPKRATRLYMGTRSMSELLRRYGFQDSSGCVNHKRTQLSYGDAPPAQGPPSWIPTNVRDSPGIPQFYPTSGVCWFAAMCGTSFMNDDVRRLLETHFPDEDLRKSFGGCNFDRDVAQHLRKRLWYEYAVGDNVENPPEMDGRNGFAEFSVLCAQGNVPMRRYRERDGHLVRMDNRIVDQRGRTHRVREPKRDEKHLLALRFQDGDHTSRFPIQRRVRIDDNLYRLIGFYAGQKKCGHQLGILCPTGSWRDWVIVDADLHKDGISPVFVRFDGPQWLERWWEAWRHIIHVTKFGAGTSEFCNLSPWNPNNDSLEHYRGTPRPGTNSLDVLYMSIGRQGAAAPYRGLTPRRAPSPRRSSSTRHRRSASNKKRHSTNKR